ncbi:hypothetical protein GOP47_0031142 [Adiantum capillus-veneris]|nr:hypothetical protein GOP47_0031142 [Adiantum capillus-veneris]
MDWDLENVDHDQEVEDFSDNKSSNVSSESIEEDFEVLHGDDFVLVKILLLMITWLRLSKAMTLEACWI